MTDLQKLANAAPWDGDDAACAMCADAVATWCVGVEGWCVDCLARAAISAVAGEQARADKAEGLLAEAVEALRDARHNGLIYWEPNTSRGHETRAAMCARIDAILAKIKEAKNG